EKDDLEALGLLKIDILALGMLSAIRRMLDMISAWEGKKRRMQDIPAEDPVIYRRISEADTVGVFQIESRAQMAMLPRLRPQTFYDLVIEVAIVRPGPIQGDMVHPYLRRRQGLEPVSYPSEAVRQVTERTLGIPIFQEQVMQLAVVAAGFTPGEADRLRRAMAAWRKRGGLEPFEKRLIDGMAERGYSEDFARQIYNQILGFGEYGFPESHAASFALLVYVSAWLKHYYPAAFCAGLINAQPMGFYAPAQLVQDAKRHGVTVLPVDVRFSDWDCGLERQAPHKQEQERKQEQGVKPKPALRLGLRMVKGLSRDAAERLLEARGQQPFISVEDMNRRAELDRGEAEALAAAGALAGLSGNRHQTRWQVAGFDGVIPLWEKVKPRKGKEAVPLLPVPTEGEDIVADYESIGLTLGRHPLALLRDRLTQDRFNTAEGLWDLEQNALGRACGIVINRQRPQSANGVIFLTLEDETGYVNVVVWGKQVERYRRVVLGARLIGVIGHVERDSGVLHLVAERLEDHTGLLGRLVTRSRDFG
ncbi:MAG: OB-fold nucleic acid binding domain-containing protein, partial [Gammaproteobacteria bacterium]